MYDSQSSTASELLAAITRLSAKPAKTIRDDTRFRLPVTMRIGDADLCTYLARNESSFLFLPDYNSFNTRLILRTTNEAWKQDKLPTIAICPTEEAANQLQKSTAIESVSAGRFFSDLESARPVTQTFTGKKNYVIGHDENPRGKFDDIVLPSLANVVVYDAHVFSAQQLASLCDPISQVRGRLILCGDWTAIERAHPDIARTISDTLGYGLPDIPVGSHPEKAWELGNELDSYSPADKPVPLSADSKPWVIVANCWWDSDANCVRSIHSSQEEALNSVPAVFTDVWNDYMFLCRGAWSDYEPPSVSTAEWRLPISPEIGDAVRIENHAVVSVSNVDQLPPLRSPDAFRPETRETDPLAKTRPFLVFHANSDDSTLFPDHYTLAARIDAESIDHALFLSQQQAEVPWTQYPGVTPLADKPRSTQVGDVFIDHDVPKRYFGPNHWRPATTTMDPAYVQRITAEVNSYFSMPEAHKEHVPAQRLNI